MKKVFILFLFISSSSYALVDYTENDYKPKRSGIVPQKQKATSSPTKKVFKNVNKRSSSASNTIIDFGVLYENADVEMNDANGKVHLINFDGHIQTRSNIFLDFNYWQGQSTSNRLSSSSSFQKGNPELKLGFNWLQWSDKTNPGTLDFYIGYQLGQKNSELATTSNSQVLGISTAKRFNELGIGIGYEYRIKGTSKNSVELNTGNVQKLSASLGWQSSQDIRFLLEATHYTVHKSDESLDNHLIQDIKYAFVSPKVNLLVAPNTQFVFGAKFRTKRIRENEYIDARLFHLNGAYGNSYFTGLNFIF